MVLVYMLTWLGYIDGIHGTPYIAAPWIRHGLWIIPSKFPCLTHQDDRLGPEIDRLAPRSSIDQLKMLTMRMLHNTPALAAGRTWPWLAHDWPMIGHDMPWWHCINCVVSKKLRHCVAQPKDYSNQAARSEKSLEMLILRRNHWNHCAMNLACPRFPFTHTSLSPCFPASPLIFAICKKRSKVRFVNGSNTYKIWYKINKNGYFQLQKKLWLGHRLYSTWDIPGLRLRPPSPRCLPSVSHGPSACSYSSSTRSCGTQSCQSCQNDQFTLW